MDKLIVKKGLSSLLKTWIKLIAGKVITMCYGSFEFYQIANIQGYRFSRKRLNPLQIEEINGYVAKTLPAYKQELENMDITKSSQYYSYSKIKKLPARVCNIGCLYCKADSHFLTIHPNNLVYGLDFGNIIEANKDLSNPRLKLFSGYPLETLETFKNEKFDYALFTRTAGMININELLSYISILSPIASNICFLEPVKLLTYPKMVLDINKIEMMKPVKMYSGMYIHNYPKVLENFGYQIVESQVFHKDVFENILTPDHYFVYVHGRKS